MATVSENRVSVNPELQGRVFAPTEPYLVGREKIREFSRAVFATNPINRDPVAARAAGYADVVAPPTFAIVIQESTLAQLLAEPDAGIDFSRVVHGDQKFSYARPLRPGDRLVTTVEITAARHMAGNDMLTLSCASATEEGEHVVTSVCMVVGRGPNGDAS